METEEKMRAYIAKQNSLREVLQKLGRTLSDYPLTETVKWGMPTGAFLGNNLIVKELMACFSGHREGRKRE